MTLDPAANSSNPLQPAPRWSGPAAVLAGMIWIFSWIMNALTRDGTREVLGLSEPGWRTLLNPGLVLAAAAMIALQSTQKAYVRRWGLLGTATLVIGLGAMVAGNVLEFQVSPLADVEGPGFEKWETIGWGVFGVGFMVSSIGLIVSGLAGRRVRDVARWRSRAGLAFGGLLVLGFAIALGSKLVGFDSVAGASAGITAILGFGLGWIALGGALAAERGAGSRSEAPR